MIRENGQEPRRVMIPIDSRTPLLSHMSESRPSNQTENHSFFKEQRERMERGEMPLLWDLVSRFEIPDFKKEAFEISPWVEYLETRRIEAESGLHGFVNQLKRMKEQGAEEHTIFEKILERFYVHTSFRLRGNGLMNVFTPERGKKANANCEGRAKAISIVLEELGYDPETQIFFENFSDHVRTVVQGKDRKRYVLEGTEPIKWKPTKGTTLSSANDVKRVIVGLEPESIEHFALGKTYFHGSRLALVLMNLDRSSDTQPIPFSGGERPYGNFLSSLPIAPMLEKVNFLLSVHLKRLAQALEKKGVIPKSYSPYIKRAAQTAAAVVFLGYGVDRLDKIREEGHAPSWENITSEVHENIAVINAAAEEAMKTVNEMIEKMGGKLAKELPHSIVTPTEGSTPTSSNEQPAAQEMIIELIERLPDELEENGRTHFDATDFFLTRDKIIYPYTPDGKEDRSHLRIQPRKTEHIVSGSFWKYVIQEMEKSTWHPGGYFPS
ncbi:MAG: hypothetical protein NUV84_00115, partial [Candidatus Uhrbacteria bacterium]|nr:hypothetical protein [Candidatus Uhrbacteria bacterium]